MIDKPMLAATLESLQDVNYPTAVSEKIDGIRAIIREGTLQSRTLKPIPNKYFRDQLEAYLPEGADGEIIVGKSFQESTSAVMTKKGYKEEPFMFYWFDYVKDSPKKGYMDRMNDIREWISKHPLPEGNMKIIPLYPIIVSDKDTLEKIESEIVSKGGEGIMLRTLNGPYKFGRSTNKEGFLVKWKRFTDSEAVITGYEQLISEENGPQEALGSFIVKEGDISFKIGSGYTAEQRSDYWKRKDKLIGKLVKYKFFEIGVKTAPRFPIFIGFRDPKDML